MSHKPVVAPTSREKIAIRSLIVIGLFSVFNFFYWFLDFDLIEDKVLYWMLMSLILFDAFRLIYIWYHYWDISIPSKPVSNSKPSVDVLTTYYPGEPKKMLKETLLACLKMTYPHTTYLCDEGDDDELKLFCQEHGIVHVTRNNRINAKAGNINNALKQATGELCLILDPDHVPKEDFLEEIIPYFEDEAVGFVQTVQSYYNMQESQVAQAAAEQTFHFYGPVMMCMNSYGTVNAIGANCLFRRSALDSIGGHAAGLSEDMHTAMQLHAKGWKSLYVPIVSSAGLAPATLTAYFKQQLKWSRGTLELLITSFIKLFNKLTFRQKIHYGILPLHYLTGLFYMICFLIPIVSLLTSDTPWKGNMLNFGLITFPVIASILGIRFYVQKWVINKGERGMHLLGGVLMQISWSIYLMGLFYTIIRKRVPYIPTAKEGENKTKFIIVLPNLIIFGVCIFSIVYGLMRDFTPFSLFMSGFALWNAFIMIYTLKFAYQKSVPVQLDFENTFKNFNRENVIEKALFTFWQKTAFIILTFTLVACGIFNYRNQEIRSEGLVMEVQKENSIKYLGLFAPSLENGLSDFSRVSDFESTMKRKVDIISFYVAWDKNLEKTFPNSKINDTYKNNSLPMITWEPWANTFIEASDKTHVFDLISNGSMDEYIENFALKIKGLNKPVFLRFAHEFDNPFYPWYDERENAHEVFRLAWKRTKDIFERNGATNVIWIYNPWKSENLLKFYPGKDYVDWIGLNILNYATHDDQESYFSFTDLYEPFREEIKKIRKDYPVMISEFGSKKDSIYQAQWINKALFDIQNDYPEIDALVYFNSRVDNNIPGEQEGDKYIDWTIPDYDQLEYKFKQADVPSYIFQPLNRLEINKNIAHQNIDKLKNIKGVNLKNGQKWDQDYHVLTRKNLEYDLQQIKNLGLNTIKYTSNGIYDYNVLNLSEEFGLNVSIGFWIPEDIDFVNDSIAANEFKNYIIEFVNKYKDRSNIISWNLQHGLLSLPRAFIHEPQMNYQNSAYYQWLSKLTSEMKAIDPERPIVLEFDVNDDAPKNARIVMSTIQEIDVIGLNIKDDSDPTLMINTLHTLKIPFLYTDVSINIMDYYDDVNTDSSFFVSNWRDQHQINKVTFDGLVDRKGRLKSEYFNLAEKLNKFNGQLKLPSFKILRRLELLETGMEAYYCAMTYDVNKGWMKMNKGENIRFEWALVKNDGNGNFITINEVGKDPELIVKIPEYYETYLLRLTVEKNGVVSSTMITLNTPYNN